VIAGLRQEYGQVGEGVFLGIKGDREDPLLAIGLSTIVRTVYVDGLLASEVEGDNVFASMNHRREIVNSQINWLRTKLNDKPLARSDTITVGPGRYKSGTRDHMRQIYENKRLKET
jgi:hypothetical protein